MSVIVVAIAPKHFPQAPSEMGWEVDLLINQQELKYEFVRRSVPIGDCQGWVLNAEPAFYHIFKHNQPIVRQIDRLVQQVAQGESVKLPIKVGAFLSPEAVQAEMAHRWYDASEVG